MNVPSLLLVALGGALADLALRVGDPVWAAVKASEIAVSAET